LAEAVAGAAELDPGECRREAARRFTPARMAARYLRLYERVAAAALRSHTAEDELVEQQNGSEVSA
jgi:hypothetical protein